MSDGPEVTHVTRVTTVKFITFLHLSLDSDIRKNSGGERGIRTHRKKARRRGYLLDWRIPNILWFYILQHLLIALG